MKKLLTLLIVLTLVPGARAQEASPPEPARIAWDADGLRFDGRPAVPVMGEIHYSRLPAAEWPQAVRRMKEGGVTIVATYIFWNHIEEQEGVFDWSGQRSLRDFLEVCRAEAMPVVVRMGPFCHGEARNGGIPDWVFKKGCRVRSEEPAFLALVERLYRQIFTQVQGLQWKEGGPVLAAQFDNEYRGHGSYLMALKRIATGIGFDLPLYTRTGWPELASPVPYGEILPLYGDYADGFWERSLEPTAGNYYQAFQFKAFRSSTAIATEQFGEQGRFAEAAAGAYPYFTCELGGGMMCAYHRRPWIYPEDTYALAVVKLGSGSNLLGYYMYHGGTNPDGKLHPLNETQRTPATNYNDLPEKTYDFQAPLGEFGQRNPSYWLLRKLHLFLQDFGEVLAPMQARFPVPQEAPKGDDSFLRWSFRTDGRSGFVFVNNYERLQQLSAKRGVQFEVCGVRFPQRPMTVPAGTTCIFPVRIAGIDYATAQLIAQRDGKIYLEQIAGIPTEISVDGRILRNVRPLGPDRPVCRNIYLVDSETAGRLFLDPEPDETAITPVAVVKKAEAQGDRTITIGVNGVAEAPTDADFERAARYTIDLPEGACGLLQIDYRGDCARLYADGRFIGDNFWNGRPFLYGLWRLPAGCRQLELRILPLQEGMPVCLPAEADPTPGEAVKRITITRP